MILSYYGGMILKEDTLALIGNGGISTASPTGIRILGGPIQQIGAAHAAALAPARHFVREWESYTVHCPGASRLEVGSQSIESDVEGMFQVRYENQLGYSRIRAFDASGTQLETRHVEVVSHKLGEPGRSLKFLKLILADLTSERGAMSFMPRSATSRTVRQVQRPPSLLVQYFFLLNNADAIQEAVQHILRFPHRVLDDASEHVSVFELTEIDPDVVLQLVQGGAEFDVSSSPPRVKSAPEGVWFRMPRESFDSAENQFVKAVAAAMADACDEVLNASWLQSHDDAGVRRRREKLTGLGSKLQQFQRAPMFDDVGSMECVPSSSRVMQRRLGYRDVNLLWDGFLQAREPVWQRMQQAIDLRDIATLYEYWVWFALCREVQDVYQSGRPELSPTAVSDTGLSHGLAAKFPELGTLSYNATRQTYSGIPLRPDYLWEPVQGQKVGFDAKFRLAWDGAPLDADESQKQADPIASAKVDDLVKMHAYRDAIPGLRCAVVLYPGHVAQFRTTGREAMDGVSIGDVLREELHGVGAIPMSPEGWDDE